MHGGVATPFESRDAGKVDLCFGLFDVGLRFGLGHFWMNFVGLFLLCFDGFEQRFIGLVVACIDPATRVHASEPEVCVRCAMPRHAICVPLSLRDGGDERGASKAEH